MMKKLSKLALLAVAAAFLAAALPACSSGSGGEGDSGTTGTGSGTTNSGGGTVNISIDASNYKTLANVTTFASEEGKLTTASSSKTIGTHKYTEVIKFGGGVSSAYIIVDTNAPNTEVNVQVDGKSGTTGTERSFMGLGASEVECLKNDANDNFTKIVKITTDSQGKIKFYSANSSFQVWGIYITN